MKVAILLPQMGTIHAALHDWMTVTAASVPIVEYKTYHVTPLEKAFNVLHRRFLASDCTHAFVVNSDEMPPRKALERLLEHDKDMVSCVAPKWDEEYGPLPVASRLEDGKFYYLNGPGLMQADRCGFSGILIKREVMEAIPVGTYEYKAIAKCWCGWEDSGVTGATVCPKCGCEIVADGTDFCSPEFHWLDVARGMGFELYVDFDLQMHHFVECDLWTVNRLIVKAHDEEKKKLVELVKSLWHTCNDAEIVEALLDQE